MCFVRYPYNFVSLNLQTQAPFTVPLQKKINELNTAATKPEMMKTLATSEHLARMDGHAYNCNSLNALKANENKSNHGWLCFLVVFSSLPRVVLLGTYSTQTSLESASDCTDCTAGSYCGDPGLTAPDGTCDAGYYCPPGSKVGRPM